jgi:hypothetical protein
MSHYIPTPRITCCFAIIMLMVTSGCSTVVEGRSQKIAVNSSPQGAQCLFKQADEVVGRVTTPGSAEIKKSKNDLVIYCNKPGYESATFNNHSDFSIASLGNMVFGQFSFVGNAVDSVSGANNKYDSTVFVTLKVAETPTAFPAPPGAPPILQLSPQIAANMSMQVPMPAQAMEPVAIPTPASTIYNTNIALLTPAHDPAMKAAMLMGTTAQKVGTAQELPELTYAQQVAEAAHRPPFEVTQ